MRFQFIFTLKNQLPVFKEVIEADSEERARAKLRQQIKEAGFQLKRITAVIELK